MEQATYNKKKQNLIIFLCWLVYTVAYFGRYSYNSGISVIEEIYGVSHAESGMVATMFFFAYGVGQIVHGLLCKFYKKRQIIAGVLIISAIINLSIFIGVPFVLIKYLWLLNGVVQSVLWSSLVMIIAQSVEEKLKKKAVLVMATTVPIGTALVYGVSALFTFLNNYIIVFLFAYVAMLLCAVVWFLLYHNDCAKIEEVVEESSTPKTKVNLSGALIGFLVVISLFAICDNFLKDGIQTWAPTILKEIFSVDNSVSIALSIILPCLGVFGAMLATFLYDRIKDFVVEIGLLFLGTSVLVLFITSLVNTTMWLLFTIVFGLIILLMNAVNNVVTSMVPLYMKKVNAGAIAGVLNGCCYFGSTISSYLLGYVADNSGWQGVFVLFLISAVTVTIIAIGYTVINNLILKRNKSNG